MGQLAKAQKPQAPRSFQDTLRGQWHKIEAVLPRHMSGERLFQMAVSTYNHDPKLASCDMTSLLSCVMKCSALGVEPSSVDGLGRAYILPFYNKKIKRNEATFILGYKGMIDLARRSGQIMDISARAVYEGDEFEYEFGLDEKLRHVPCGEERTPDKLTHVYMVAHFKDGGHYIDVMTRSEVEKVRQRSKAKDSGPWVTDYEAMARKSVIRRGFPYLPVSIEAQMAAASDETDGGFTATVVESGAVLPEPVDVEVAEVVESGSEAQVPADPSTDTPEGETAPQGQRRAACRTCGNAVDATEDATIDDLNQFMCCDKPDYEWV